MPQTALNVLKDTFGYTAFRDAQSDIIDTVSNGGDALVLMPTGGGKSLCYQIPALLRDGTAIVISPLIALMHDQVVALKQNGVNAAFLNSSLNQEDAATVEQSLLSGDLDLLYVAPERLLTGRFLNLLSQSRLALFAIDEAHCVSQWGHDFRPEYAQLSILHERFPEVPRMALTATADSRTRDEIIEKLDLGRARIFVSSFDRPNIRYAITGKDNAKQALLRFISSQHQNDAGIVYCLSRKRVDSFADFLCQKGYRALPYHAGMASDERERNQSTFLQEEGVIIVATIAFGMGIDKPNVRFVAHMDLPKSIEAYYQETGRAGRDGLPANAWMAYGMQDVIQLRSWTEQSEASDSKKRIEHDKLNALLALCETSECRRQMLLAHFDEALEQPCGNCDNCINGVETWDATEAAQKALSCIYRTEQRFGTAHVIDVLLGKETDKIERFGHQHLGTFGIGSDLDKNTWRSLIRQLVAFGYADVDVEGYNALRLTEKCRSLLRGDITFQVRKPERKVKLGNTRSVSIALAPEDEPMFDALRARRLELAHEQGVPPYVIFHDKTLKSLAEHRPQSHEEMLSISGIGQHKLDRYGDDFLEVICEHSAAEPGQPSP